MIAIALAFLGRYKLVFGIAALGGIALLLVYCSGKAEGARAAEEALAQANFEAIAIDTTARENAARARVADAEAVAEQKEEMIDAIQSVDDTLPDPVRIALGCQRLRAAGKDTTLIPACGRSSGAAEAGSDL